MDEAIITEGVALVAGYALNTGLHPHGLQLRLSPTKFKSVNTVNCSKIV